MMVRNDGLVFREEDWNRLKKIAEGNPDENKIGAFGESYYWGREKGCRLNVEQQALASIRSSRSAMNPSSPPALRSWCALSCHLY